jgi:hypothetical protein
VAVHPIPSLRKGRSFAEEDAPLIQEMHDLLQSGKARNPHDAAQAVVRRTTAGHGTPESKVRRLKDRYKKFQSQRK